jgi:hypothetical protein
MIIHKITGHLINYNLNLLLQIVKKNEFHKLYDHKSFRKNHILLSMHNWKLYCVKNFLCVSNKFKQPTIKKHG